MIGLPALALRGLRRRAGRTLLTTLGVTIAAAAYLVLVTSGRGLARDFDETLATLGGEVTVQRAGAALPESSRLTPAEVERLATLPHVKRVSPVAIGLARVPGNSHFLVVGVVPDDFALQPLRILAGRRLHPSPGEVIVGRHAARLLELAPGDEVELTGRSRFAVVGVFETGHGLMDNAAVVDLAAAQRAFNLGDQVNIVFLSLDHPSHLEPVIGEIERTVPRVSASASNLYIGSFQQLAVVQRFASYLALVALVIAALGVANTMNMSVAERTVELGVLRAIGWRPRRVALLVLAEAAELAAAGAVLGTGLAQVVLAVLTRSGMPWLAAAALEAGLIAEGVALTLAAGVLGGLPALLRALRTSPATCLRSAA